MSSVAAASTRAPSDFTWIDLNGDGLPELLQLTASMQLRVLGNLGGAGFEDRSSSFGLLGDERILHVDVSATGAPGQPPRVTLLLADGVVRVVTNMERVGSELLDLYLSPELQGPIRKLSWLDVDADGDEDLWLETDATSAGLYLREGGQLKLTALPTLMASPSGGSVVMSPRQQGESPSATELEDAGSGGHALGQAPTNSNRESAATSSSLTATPAPGAGPVTQSLIGCVSSILDVVTGACLEASTVPELGRLYPLSSDFFVDPTGRVGIGTVTPDATLDVAGGLEADELNVLGGIEGVNGLLSGRLTLDGPGGYKLMLARAGFSTWGLYLTSNGSNGLGFYDETASEHRLFLAENGLVGIGTTTPSHALTVEGAIQSRSGGFVFPDGSVQTSAAAFPGGVIVMWSGASPPTGWAVCDGSNGTPDLRSRFVVGQGGSFALGDTGGSFSHTHSGSTYSAGGGTTVLVSGPVGGSVETVADNDVANPHSHVLNIGSTSSAPPYYALAFIMKL